MKLTLQENLTYLFLSGVSWIVSFIPRSTSLMFGRGLGLFIHSVFPIRKDIALGNLEITFPKNSRRENLRILKRTYRHFGMVLMEFIQAPYLSAKKLNSLFTVEGISLNALREIKIGILSTAHMGNWELCMHILGQNNIDFSAVALIQRNKGAHKFFSECREASGSKLIYKKDSSRIMLQVLRSHFLGLASDQWAGKSGMRMPFFNRESSMATGAAIFHLKTGAPIFYVYCILSPDFKYKLLIVKPDLDQLPDNKQEAVRVINELYISDLEKIIQKYPEQYFWFHRKWRT